MVQVSDKFGRICVSNLIEYEKQGEMHIGKDKIVGWKEVEDNNKRLNGTSKSMRNIFKLCVDGSEETAKWCCANYNCEFWNVSVMRVTYKLY